VPVAKVQGYQTSEQQLAGLAAITALAVSVAPTRPIPTIARPAPSIDSQVLPLAKSPPVPVFPSTSPSTHSGPSRPHRLPKSVASIPWVLVGILVVQAMLSTRLIGTNTAFTDESTYLHAGRIEILSLFEPEGSPWYQTYFSGAPVLYPILGAIANSIDGLIAARALSTFFMLGATAFLFASTNKLFGSYAAAFSAAVYVALGPTQFLGAFATYDPMSLFLLAMATWCVIYALNARSQARWMLAAAAILALANATKYASALFDPIVVGIAFLAKAERKFMRTIILSLDTLIILAVGLALGGPPYVKGILWTTLARGDGTDAPSVVLEHSWSWIGSLLVLAVIATVSACLFRSRRLYAPLCVLLTIAAMLAPANQARIHTLTSLQKHVDFGAWFAAIAAGYGFSLLVRWIRHKWTRRAVAALLAMIVVLPMTYVGVNQSNYLFHSWPNSDNLIVDLTTLMRTGTGHHYLVEDYNVPMYYLQDRVPWQEWNSTWYFFYKGHTGITAYRQAIREGYFSLIVLDFNATRQLDAQIVSAVQQNAKYRLVAVIRTQNSFGAGNYTIWAYEPDGPTNP
jgi:Dolichyl-phosphate-mannose-protein mannosyltransferase